MDISKEPPSIQARYGTEHGKVPFVNNCLLVGRILESCIRFVQLSHLGWDTRGSLGHHDIVSRLPNLCCWTDRGSAPLVKKLTQRPLLKLPQRFGEVDSGRTPMNEATTSQNPPGVITTSGRLLCGWQAAA